MISRLFGPQETNFLRPKRTSEATGGGEDAHVARATSPPDPGYCNHYGARGGHLRRPLRANRGHTARSPCCKREFRSRTQRTGPTSVDGAQADERYDNLLGMIFTAGSAVAYLGRQAADLITDIRYRWRHLQKGELRCLEKSFFLPP